MRTDTNIKQDVYDALEWLPSIDEAQIKVIVNNGIVNLTGTVNSCTKKREVENVAKGVFGVKR